MRWVCIAVTLLLLVAQNTLQEFEIQRLRQHLLIFAEGQYRQANIELEAAKITGSLQSTVIDLQKAVGSIQEVLLHPESQRLGVLHPSSDKAYDIGPVYMIRHTNLWTNEGRNITNILTTNVPGVFPLR